MKHPQYWLLLKIAKSPKAFTFGAGLLIAALLALASATSIWWLDEARTSEKHENAIQTMQAVLAESADLLQHLATHGNLDCGHISLVHLNTHLLQSRFLREIGILDADDRLVCSSAVGRLPHPVKGNYPASTSLSGIKILVDVPLQMANKKVNATILQQGGFNAVVSPHITEDVYSSADAVWLRGATSLELLRPISAKADTLMHMRERAARASGTATHRQGLGYELITSAPDIDLVLQTQRRAGAIIQDNELLLAALLMGSVVIAALAAGTLAPYVTRLGAVQHRVRFLCREEHLVLLYQPIFDLASGKPIGCEVLMRLKEENTIWMPDQLIPTLLAAGLTKPLDYAVTRKAMRELSSLLPVQPEPFHVALNYFPASIDYEKLSTQFASQETVRKDIQICIEITEHSLSSELAREVKAFKEQGFLIAIDDFGTGYSNLKSVTNLSPNVLKIDKSLVFELEEATIRSNLIPEIVSIARAVDAMIVAEGIEKLEQVQLLADLGVQFGQGYALARPMKIKPFLAFLREKTSQAQACT
ncbi:EAL domain-containing protein [Eoetvoesiella caeni]|uniref:cyclic-guanylate-specific phosphodiesterase n=1 Tax=Eoetvoesiella caeni TaxID=645616 RepID=A0A366H432_9BURK|nr:EAL domain-containing protein [Eoetvoesiella caeni]MCI2810490.1 EAL domain-containing protein [Eoetvoesiella caeni]NYT54838.1 EAL domain-containing protein [Eoetvoesiella caeni]RBP36752.1 sensor c-di-GMP phosphodiesterase-like protein [Eoetvoesiella caeni]